MLQLFGIARAVVEAAASEDLKSSRTKPLQDQGCTQACHYKAGDCFCPEAQEGSPGQGEGLQEQSCPTVPPPLLLRKAPTASRSKGRTRLSLNWCDVKVY